MNLVQVKIKAATSFCIEKEIFFLLLVESLTLKFCPSKTESGSYRAEATIVQVGVGAQLVFQYKKAIPLHKHRDPNLIIGKTS